MIENTNKKALSERSLGIKLEKKISNEELVSILRKSQCTISQLGVSELQIIELRDIGYKVIRQYEKSKKDFVYYILDKGDDPFVFLPRKENENTLKCAKMADIHIGSNEFDKNELVKVLQYLWYSGYRYIFIAGDIMDGKDVYNGHDMNLQWRNADRQADAVIAILSMFNFHYIVSQGNHDESFKKKGGADILSLVEEKMASRGRDFTYLKSFVGYIVFNDAVIKLIHLGSNRGNTISDTYPSQKNMDAMFKTSLKHAGSNVNDVKIFGKMYPVVNFISGHFHGLAKFVYGNVICESPLTFQHTTDFINRMGNRSRVGCRVSTLTIQDGRCIDEKGSIILIENLEELYEMEKKRNKNSKQKTKKISTRKTKVCDTEIDIEKINKALKKLFKNRFMPIDELGLSLEEISYINQTLQYNIYIENGRVVLKTEDDINSCVIYSPLPETGIILYLEISNLQIGSKFFNEAALRYMLDIAKKQGVKHIHLAGDIVWGKPVKKYALYTKIFHSQDQANEVIRILSDYPNFHYYAINGDCERSFIDSMVKEVQINTLFEVSTKLNEKGIKFTYINNGKCDFVIFGMVLRMIHEGRVNQPYTRDYPIVIPERTAMAKGGNKVIVDGKEFDLGAIYYGSIRNTQETYYGGTYVTTTSGPTYDPENRSDSIQSNPECGIVTIYVKDGVPLKLVRELILPPINSVCLPQYVDNLK